MSDNESSPKGFDALPLEVQLAILEGMVDFEKIPIVYNQKSGRFFFRVNHAAVAVSQLAMDLYHRSGLVRITFKGKKELSPSGMIPEVEESVVRSWTTDSELRNTSDNSPEPFQIVTEARALMPHVKIEETATKQGDQTYEVTTTVACAKAYFTVLAAHQLPMLTPVIEDEAEPADEEGSGALQPSTFNIAIAMMGSRVHGQRASSLVQLHERVCLALKLLGHPSNTLYTPERDVACMTHLEELSKAFKRDDRTVLEWLQQVTDVVEHRKHHIDRLVLCGYGKDLSQIGDNDPGNVLLATQLQKVLRQWGTNREKWYGLLLKSEKPTAKQLVACLRRLQVSIAYNIAFSEPVQGPWYDMASSDLDSTGWCIDNNKDEISLLCPCHIEITVPNFSLNPGDKLFDHRETGYIQIELRRMSILWHYLRGDLDRTPNFGDTKRKLEELQRVVRNDYGPGHEPLEESLRIVDAAYQIMNQKIAANSANNPVAESEDELSTRSGRLFDRLALQKKLSDHRGYTFSAVSSEHAELFQSDFTPGDAATTDTPTANV